MNPKYTITVFTENHPGLLSRIANIFTRRKLNIESLTVSRSEYEGIHRFNILLRISDEQVQKLVKHIEKQVEVFKAFARKEDTVLAQETILFKIPTNKLLEMSEIENITSRYDVRLMEASSDYSFFEKTGKDDEINRMIEELQNACNGDIRFMKSVKSNFSKSDAELINVNHGTENHQN